MINKKIIDSSFNLYKFTAYFSAIILIFIFGSKILSEYKTIYVQKDQSIERINYLTFFIYDVIGDALSIFASKDEGLPKVKIYVN